jgi:CheY-like chemotaxis protein
MRQIVNLMLVDDDEDDRDIFLSVVESISPDIVCSVATNGREALMKLGGAETLPEKIFLDLNMPLMDGKQFLREIKKNRGLSKIPVIILSTSSDKETIALTKELGAEDFITKPDKYSGWKDTLKKHIQ